jgi:MFS family permease
MTRCQNVRADRQIRHLPSAVAQARYGAGMSAPQRYPGWSVVWVAFIVAFFAWGIGFHGMGVFLQTLHATKGWPIATISAAITAHFLIGAAIVVYLPEVHRKLGLAQSTILGAALTAFGIVSWSISASPSHLFAAAIFSGSGWALTSGAAINAMIVPWFDKERPKAIGHAFNGSSFGGVIFAPLLVGMISQIGFPQTALIVGSTMVLLVAPLAHRWLRDGPEQPGLAADGMPGGAAATSGANSVRSSRRVLINSRAFVTLTAAFALALFAQVGVLSHLLPRLSTILEASGAAIAVSVTTLSAVAGRMLLARVIGNNDRRYAACANFFVQTIGVSILCVADTAPMLLLGCVLFGLGVGNVVSMPTLIAQQEFRAADVGTVVALVVAINQAVFALAPAIFGAVRDFASSYTASFAIAAAIQVAAAGVVLIGRNGMSADRGPS